MRPIDKFILHVVHNWKDGLNEAYAPAVMTKLMDKFKEEADDLNIEINDEQLKKYIERFDKIKDSPRTQEKDLFKYSLSQLIRLITSSKGTETPETVDITPDVVYHNDDDTIIVYNGSKEDNCIRYGRGERWCITRGSYATYRYNPDKSYPTFYLAQNNNLSTEDALSFVAIQVRNPQTTSENQRYVYTNRKNSPLESQPMSFSQLEREIPWLREIPNIQQVLRYIPLNTGEKVTQQYKNKPISIREWIKLPFDVKQQYLVVRKDKTLFDDISNDEFLSKYLPKFPQLAEFIAITPGIIKTEELLKHLDAFSNSDRRSIIANMRDKVNPTYLKSETLPFDVKKLLTKLDKWDLDSDERVYVTSDGNAIVKLELGDDITVGVYTAEDDYPSIKLNKRTSKYLTDYPELDKIPFKNLIKLSSDEVIDKSLVDQTLEAAKNDPDSAIIVKDTDNGQIIVDSNSFASYKVDNGKITQIPFDSEEVQALFDEQTDNEGFQQNILNLFYDRNNIPSQIDRVGLTSILKSIPYTRRIITPNYSSQPMVMLTTDEENPRIFAAYTGPNTQGVTIFRALVEYGQGDNWRNSNYNSRFTPEMINAYFDYLRRSNLAFSDESLLRALSGTYDVDTDTKKAILTNPNLPLQDTNIYRPAEYNGTVYLINTQDPAESKKVSDTSGKLIKANINTAAATRLLRAQAAQAEPEAEPGAAQAEPAAQGAAAPEAQAGERRRGRPAGVGNTPREPQQRAQGNIDIPTQFNDRGLEAGFTNLPRNDFRRLNVDDATQVPRIGDRGATARDNQLGRAGQVTSVFNVGPSKIYFIRLNTPEPTTIASINIQPGNRNYVVVGNRSYSLNSPRELMTFLQNRDLAEGLRTSLFKVHLQENPYMIDEIKQLDNMKNLREAKSMDAVDIHNILQTGQDRTQNFIDDNGLDGKKLADYVRQHKDSPRKYIIRDVISGKNDPKLETFKKELIKKLSGLKENMLKRDYEDILSRSYEELEASREYKPGFRITFRNKNDGKEYEGTVVQSLGPGKFTFKADQDSKIYNNLEMGSNWQITQVINNNDPDADSGFGKWGKLTPRQQADMDATRAQADRNKLEEKVDTESEFDVIRGGKIIARNVKFFPNGRDYRVGNKVDTLDPNDSTQPSKLGGVTDMINHIKSQGGLKEDLKNYIREALKKRLTENQPAPSRETEPGETETIPDRGTEEEEKRRRIGNPDVKPRPKAMNENEQEIIKKIVARFKSKK